MAELSHSLVQTEFADGVARVTLNRPGKRNALTQELLDALQASVTDNANNDAVRLLVLDANGPAFCAGMDLAEMEDRARQPDAVELWQADARRYRDVLAALATLSVPTLAVVQGPAVAGGLGFVLACDVVLASDDAFFVLPEPQRGITAAVVTPLLAHRIGPGRAAYVLLSGRRISAREALTLGLCHEVVSAAGLPDHRDVMIQSILTGAPSALATTKRCLLECTAPNLLAQLDAAMRISAEARETDDAREGLAAFLEKRKPVWSPRS